MPGPASCVTPAGHLCGGDMSVLLYQLDDTTTPSFSSFVCSSFIVLYFCATVYVDVYVQTSKKKNKKKISHVPLVASKVVSLDHCTAWGQREELQVQQKLVMCW